MNEKMNKKVKKKWVEALKSGKYKKGKGALRQGNRFCCLGVLCDLYRNETGKGEWTPSFNYAMEFKDGNDSSSTNLTLSVVDWAGVSSSSPLVKGSRLSYLNDEGADGNKFEFPQIAELIEEHL